jgi:hypothetical protein
MATRVFHDDFEGGISPSWVAAGKTLAASVSVCADATGPHAGTGCLEGNWDGTRIFTDPLVRTNAVLEDWDYTSEMFVRLWFRLDANVDPLNGMKIMRLGGGGGGGQMYYNAVDMTGNDAYELFQYFETMNYTSGPITYTGGVDAGDLNWHKLEIYIKHNAPGNTDGIVRAWFDGVLELENAACTSVATGETWKQLVLVSNWSSTPPDAVNNIYFDDVEIFSDATTGDACTGSMSDASIQASGGGGGDGSPPTSGIGRRLNIGNWA